MNSFSQTLSSYIEKKDANISQMAAFCNIDRSSMYKIVHGTRKPSSEDFVCQLSTFLKLSPEESEHFMEQYRILLLGEKEYIRRKGVHEFLLECFDAPSAKAPASYRKVFSSFPGNDENSCALHGYGNILNAFGYVAQEEMAKENGLLRVRMQPDTGFFDMLKSVTDSMTAAGRLRIRHLLALDGNNMPGSGSTYNLDLLKSLLPAVREFSDYDMYCYHTNLHNGRVTFSFLPYVVISTDYVLQMSQDFKFGMLLKNRDTVTFCCEVFDKMLGACIPMTFDVRNIRDLLYYGRRRVAGSGPISFQMYPCLSFFLTPELLEKYVRKEIPGRSFILRAAMEIARNDLAQIGSSPATILVSEQGLREFLDSGILREFPDDLYLPPSLEDRVKMLRSYLTIIDQYSVSFRIVRSSFGNTSSRTSIWVEDSCVYILFTNTHGNQKYLYLRDCAILDSFREYFRNIPDLTCLNGEESIRLLRSLLDEAERKLAGA